MREAPVLDGTHMITGIHSLLIASEVQNKYGSMVGAQYICKLVVAKSAHTQQKSLFEVQEEEISPLFLNFQPAPRALHREKYINDEQQCDFSCEFYHDVSWEESTAWNLRRVHDIVKMSKNSQILTILHDTTNKFSLFQWAPKSKLELAS